MVEARNKMNTKMEVEYSEKKEEKLGKKLEEYKDEC